MYLRFPTLGLALSILFILPTVISTQDHDHDWDHEWDHDWDHRPSFEEALFKALAKIPDAKEYLAFLKQYPQVLAPAAAAAKTNPIISFAPSNEATIALLSSPDTKVKRGVGSGLAGAGALMAVGQTGVSRKRRGLFRRQVGPPDQQRTLKTVLTDPKYVNLGPGEAMRIVSATDLDKKDCPVSTITAGLGDVANITSEDFKFAYGTIRSVDSWFTLPLPISQTLKKLSQTWFLSGLTSTGLITKLDSTPRITIFVPIDSAFHHESKLSSCELEQHVIEDATLYTPDIVLGKPYKTKAGTTITVTVKNGKYYVNDALITKSNIITKNGVVHFIDKVLVEVDHKCHDDDW